MPRRCLAASTGRLANSRRCIAEHRFQGHTAPARCGDLVARELGMTEAAVKMAVSRLRQRFGETVREEVRVTVSTPAEVEAEIRYLMDVVSE